LQAGFKIAMIPRPSIKLKTVLKTGDFKKLNIPDDTISYFHALFISPVKTDTGMIHHFKLVPFLVGLVAGYLLLMYYHAPPNIIYEYPHPQNINDRVYRDKNGVCYSYTATKVGCDKNEATLRTYPLQT
jgi:hypothetical protein